MSGREERTPTPVGGSPWAAAERWLRAGEPVALVTVVDHRGSVPGVAGTRMAVGPDGAVGTVGGGPAEAEMLRLARALDQRSLLSTFSHHGDDSPSVCSGTQTFSLLALDGRDLPEVESIVTTLERGGTGTLHLDSSGLSFRPGQARPRTYDDADGAWWYEETLGRIDTLYIVGGGHVSLALSRVMATLPFRIVVLDDRAGLETMRANSFADELRVVDYRSIADEVPEGNAVYVVIMTHGHLHDLEVLEALVDHHIRYLGMLGSDAKVQHIFGQLESRGVPGTALARVHAPVGLAIGSHTPEEIAISIAAEILAVRSGRRRRQPDREAETT